MKYSQALDKFSKQEKTIKSFVKCFTEKSPIEGQVNKLSFFLDQNTNIKNTSIIEPDGSTSILVSPKDYYIVCVLGSYFIKAHKLSNIYLIGMAGEQILNVDAVIENAKSSKILNQKILDKIEGFEEYTPC